MNIIEKITNATVGKVVDVIDKHLPLSPETRANVEKEVLQIITNENQAYYAAAQNIIVTEAKGNWLQRSWRPLLMMEIVFIVGFNFILVPILRMFEMVITPLDLPGQLWTLMEIGVGGYIVGRSGEKVAEKIIKK